MKKNLNKHLMFLGLIVLYAILFFYYLQHEVDEGGIIARIIYFLYLGYFVFMEIWDDSHDVVYLFLNVILAFIIGICVVDDFTRNLTLIAVFLKFAMHPLYFGLTGIIPEIFPHLHSILFILLWGVCSFFVGRRIAKRV